MTIFIFNSHITSLTHIGLLTCSFFLSFYVRSFLLYLKLDFFFLYSSDNFHLSLLKFVLLNLTQSPKSSKEKFNYTSIPLNNQHNEGRCVTAGRKFNILWRNFLVKLDNKILQFEYTLPTENKYLFCCRIQNSNLGLSSNPNSST